MPTSTPPWPAISVAAALTYVSARPLSAPPARLPQPKDPLMADDLVASQPAATYSRRALLQGTAAAALLLSFTLPLGRARAAGPQVFAPNDFIRIDPQGKVVLIMPQVEMGQGVYTSLAMILAEELCVTLEQVELIAAPPSDALYGNPVFHLQATGNSNSVRAFWDSLRQAGATARALLIEAAAQHWQVAAASLTAA